MFFSLLCLHILTRLNSSAYLLLHSVNLLLSQFISVAFELGYCESLMLSKLSSFSCETQLSTSHFNSIYKESETDTYLKQYY